MSETKIITYNEYEFLLNSLCKIIDPSFTHIYGIPRGGLPIAVHASHYLNLKFITDLDKIKHTNNIKLLIVDDISDSGITLKDTCQKMKSLLNCNSNLNWFTMCLFIKPKTNFYPDLYGELVSNNTWVFFPWENKENILNDRKEYNKKRC